MKKIFWIRVEKSFDLDTRDEHLGWPSIERAGPTGEPQACGRCSFLSPLFRRTAA